MVNHLKNSSMNFEKFGPRVIRAFFNAQSNLNEIRNIWDSESRVSRRRSGRRRWVGRISRGSHGCFAVVEERKENER